MSFRPRWRHLPLRYRLTLLAAAAVAVAVVLVSLVAFFSVRQQLAHQLDQQLDQDARTVAAAPRQWDPRVVGPAATDPDRDGDGPHDRDGDHDVSPRVQLLAADGAPAVAAGRGPLLPVTGRARAVATGTAPRAVEDIRLNGHEYRMLTLGREDGGAVQVAVSTAADRRTLTRFGLSMLLVGLLGVASAAALGAVVARAGLRPVTDLTAAVEHVGATADLAGRIVVTGRDEIARLAGAFNGMLAALASSRAAQRLLVEDAGHELRTPLTSLRTNIELLIRAEERSGPGRRLSAEDRSRLLADLDGQTTELTQLVGELVDLARADVDPEPVERVDLAELVDLGCQRAGEPGRFATDLHRVEVFGRPVSLERMVANLLDNALKWSPPDAAVRVGLRHEHDEAGWWARLSVADSGPGIAEGDRHRVFERFYRSPEARSVPGSGLGLAIVAQAVALHRGTVTTGRSGTGGALLTVRLPALSPDP